MLARATKALGGDEFGTSADAAKALFSYADDHTLVVPKVCAVPQAMTALLEYDAENPDIVCEQTKATLLLTELSQADSKFIQQARVCRLERDTRHKQDGRVRHRYGKGKRRADHKHSEDGSDDDDGSSRDGDDGGDGDEDGDDDEAGKDADVPPLALKVACAGEVSYDPTLDHSPNGPLHVEGGVKILGVPLGTRVWELHWF